MPEPLPGELGPKESVRLVDGMAGFGSPPPVLIFTGGDPLRRPDLQSLLQRAHDLALPFAVAPAVTELLDPHHLTQFWLRGASSVSLSLDGAEARTHEEIRRVQGNFDRTLGAVRDLLALGVRVQVNTTVMRKNFRELPRLFHLLRRLGVQSWEVFFIVKTGRGREVEDLLPREWESVAQFLVDASCYGLTVRTIEAPFVRRILLERKRGAAAWTDPDYVWLRTELEELEGPPPQQSSLRPSGTLDGDGTVFVAHNGRIQPGGLLPLELGKFPEDDLVAVYRSHKILQAIRERRLHGACGACPYRQVCGGSRARAFAQDGDPLGTDPACFLATTRGVHDEPPVPVVSG
jgi:radical SAM protein with 4Fe4S-binding SPASM domain